MKRFTNMVSCYIFIFLFLSLKCLLCEFFVWYWGWTAYIWWLTVTVTGFTGSPTSILIPCTVNDATTINVDSGNKNYFSKYGTLYGKNGLIFCQSGINSDINTLDSATNSYNDVVKDNSISDFGNLGIYDPSKVFNVVQ